MSNTSNTNNNNNDNNTSHKTDFSLGTRKSLLARLQTDTVLRLLRAAYPEPYKFTPVTIVSQGDKQVDRPLREIAGKGVFTKELEDALLDGRVDMAVHSYKDVPTLMPPGLVIAAVPARHNPADVMVFSTHPDAQDRLRAAKGLDSRPPSDGQSMHPKLRALLTVPKDNPTDEERSLIVGTSSLRRKAQILRQVEILKKEYGPEAVRDVEVRDVRGNIQTRLRKLDERQFDVLVLAAAALERLEEYERADIYLGPKDMMHAVGQGALAVEIREDDVETREVLQSLHSKDTFTSCVAERAMLRELEGGCRVPIGAHTTVLDGGVLRLEAGVFSEDGKTSIIRSNTGPIEDAEQIGKDLAAELREAGAEDILASIRDL